MNDLKTRVERHASLDRPGHDYLVNDLWREILNLREQVAALAAAAKSKEWRPWFAWHPVRLLTFEWAWLRWVVRRPTTGSVWGFCGKDYAHYFKEDFD